MPTRIRRKSSSLATKMVELSIAAPQVIAHRVTRMALAGQTPSDRDKKEFELMVAEKKVAFGESLNAMAAQTVRANQMLALSLFKSFWLPSSRKVTASSVVSKVQRAATGVLSKGIEPVRRKAVANAKRLARTKLR
jgi:hypothetical protein